ncbi:transposase [Sphingomonas sp.]|uniref:transposase n=1 Tax=Sphingomonas sp. TaxID=28214 RepID=UPI001E0984CF|nr:transposase [Sphingomonas sp.]MBX9797030.1 transposase [Sphingomonas sp.]
MPRLIDPGSGSPISLAEAVELLDSTAIDARDEDGLASLGPVLARLGRNRDFLAEQAVAVLKARGQGIGSALYGAQVMLLKPPGGRYVLRANFWPAAGDPAFAASGPAAFFYGMPHDHNFPFLTCGYWGPGYWSDYYEYDAAALAGYPGEPAGLRFVGRARLEPGQLMLYRARRDVHAQLPPDAFSVSINILASDPAQPWRDQYRLDIAGNRIAAGLTTTPSEVLVALAVHLDSRGVTLAEQLARDHPSPRLRMTAVTALAGARPEMGEAVLTRAAGDPHPQVAEQARARLAALAR